jgi:hypothetical protein
MAVDIQDEYTLTNDGIDIGRDGNVTPWEETPWSSGTDFQRSTTQTIDTFDLGGRSFEVTRRPDRLNRGDGYTYDVIPTDGGETPMALDTTMTSREQVEENIQRYTENQTQGKENKQKVQELGNGWTVWTYVDDDGRQLWYIKTNDGQYVDDSGRKWNRQRAFASKSDLRTAIEAVKKDLREQNRGRENTKERVQTLDNGYEVWAYIDEDGNQRWYVKTGDGYLQADGSTSSNFHAFSSQPKMETVITDATTADAVAKLGYGWVLTETPEGEFTVAGRDENGRVYLEDDGATTSSETSFASKETARKAFRRWREENVGSKREEVNETREEQSEEFKEVLEQQGSGGGGVDVEVESSADDSGTSNGGGSSAKGGGSGPPTAFPSVETTSSAPATGEIPTAALAGVALVIGAVMLR